MLINHKYRKEDNQEKNYENKINNSINNKIKRKKRKHPMPKNKEEYWPIYRSEIEGVLGPNNADEKSKLQKIFEITPTTYDEVSSHIKYNF